MHAHEGSEWWTGDRFCWMQATGDGRPRALLPAIHDVATVLGGARQHDGLVRQGKKVRDSWRQSIQSLLRQQVQSACD